MVTSIFFPKGSVLCNYVIMCLLSQMPDIHTLHVDVGHLFELNFYLYIH